MMHAIPDKDLKLTVVESDRNVDCYLFVGLAHETVHAIFKTHSLGSNFKERFRRRVDVQFVMRRKGRRGHSGFPWNDDPRRTPGATLRKRFFAARGRPRGFGIVGAEKRSIRRRVR